MIHYKPASLQGASGFWLQRFALCIHPVAKNKGIPMGTPLEFVTERVTKSVAWQIMMLECQQLVMLVVSYRQVCQYKLGCALYH